TFDWSTAHWTVGSTANQLPGTGALTVDVTDSVVTVADDPSSAVLVIGQNNTSTVNINATKTLTVSTAVTVGANGTLNVNGNLSAAAASLNSAGITNFTATSGGNIGTVNLTNGTMTCSAPLTTGALSVSGGTLQVDSTLNATNVVFIGGTSSGSGTINASAGFLHKSLILGPETQVPGPQHTVTVGANLTGNGGLKGRTDKWACGRVILTGTNTYTGVTGLGSASSIIRADDYVGLPRDSFLDLTGYKQPAGMETGANLVREGGTAGAGKMRINFPDGGGFTAVGAVAGANPVVVCFGTLAAPESLTWEVEPFKVGSNAGYFGLNGGQFAANNTIDFRNPINLGDGSTTKKGNILVDSTAYPATMSGVLSGTGGKLTKYGNGTLILTGDNTYTGTTLVDNGKLFVNGNQSLATGNVTINGGKTLGGTGTIGGNVTIKVNARLAFNLITPKASHDSLELAATKTLTFEGASGLDITGGGTATSGSYTLVYAPGGITLTGGVLPTIGALPVDWTDASVSVSGDGKKLLLTVTVPGSSDPYTTWAGAGVAFDDDANNDGVANGMAWVLGATDKDANATSLLPTLDNTDPNYFIFTYRQKDDANTDTKTTIKAEYSSNLTGWTEAVHDGSNIIITPSDEGGGTGIDLVQVKIKRTLAVGG
ncbi:MAG: autotransporter-associated beta strand repeat-containing protein, partial [Verrucomicrobia bacterium]|nr:autotransporter-associated beta strand repeat-containing protein [Verrucomicrobiota bacterium]